MNDYQPFQGTTMCMSSGLLTATGGVATHDTTVTITYAVKGKAATKTSITTGTTPTTDHVTGAAFIAMVGGNSVANTPGEGCIVAWGLQFDGTVKCAQGPIHKLDMQGNFLTAPSFPPIKEDVAIFAYQVLKAGATAAVSIVFGTANWNATGYTNVIQNVMGLPSRPQVA